MEKNNIKVLLLMTGLVFLCACIESNVAVEHPNSRNNLLVFDSNKQVDNDDRPFNVIFALNKEIADKMMDESYKISLEYTIDGDIVLVDQTKCVLTLNKKESCSVAIDASKINKPYTNLLLKVYANGVQQSNSMNIQFGNRDLIFVADDKQQMVAENGNDHDYVYQVDLSLYSNNVQLRQKIHVALVTEGIKILQTIPNSNSSAQSCTFDSNNRVCHIKYSLEKNASAYYINAVNDNGTILTYNPVVCKNNALLTTNRRKLFIAPNTQSYFSAYNCQSAQNSSLLTGQYKGTVSLLSGDNAKPVHDNTLFISSYPSTGLTLNSSNFDIDINEKQSFVVNANGNIQYDNLKIAINQSDSNVSNLLNDNGAVIDVIDFSKPFVKFIDKNHNLITDVVIKQQEKLSLSFDARDQTDNNSGIDLELRVYDVASNQQLPTTIVNSIFGANSFDSDLTSTITINTQDTYFNSLKEPGDKIVLRAEFSRAGGRGKIQNNILNITVVK